MRGYRARKAFDGERELPGGATVLVSDDGLIVGVEPFAGELPDGLELHTFEGATLLPGLIDSHVHLCADGGPRALDQLPELSAEQLGGLIDDALARHLAAGVTTVRDLGDIGFAVVDRPASGAVEPRVLASGPPLTTVRGHCWNMGGEATGEAELRARVRERAERGADLVKVMASGGVMTPGTDMLAPQLSLEELAAVVDEAHRLGLPVTAHAHAMTAWEHAVGARVDCIEHASGLTSLGAQLPSGDVLEAMIRQGTVACPTPGVARGIAGPPPHILAAMQRAGITPEQLINHSGDVYRTGVATIVGTDGGINPAKPHGILAEALLHLTQAGLTPEQALRTATATAADALGLGGLTGRLRPGLEADLLLVDGDPLADITALRDVSLVVRRGRSTVRPG